MTTDCYLDLGALLPRVLNLAYTAGRAVMDIYRSVTVSIEYKDDGSPITEADVTSHRVLLNGLNELTPDVPVLSEEWAEISYRQRQEWQYFWLVDPLDGTKEFIGLNDE